MLSPYLSQINSYRAAQTPVKGAILLVEADSVLRESRALLLSTFNIPIQKAAGYCDVCGLSVSTSFSLVAISLAPNQDEAATIAAYVRRQSSSAKILLLGKLQSEFDDPLYDDIVDPWFNPSAFLDASKRLLLAIGANLSSQRESH
jgi:hypothetical protein